MLVPITLHYFLITNLASHPCTSLTKSITLETLAILLLPLSLLLQNVSQHLCLAPKNSPHSRSFSILEHYFSKHPSIPCPTGPEPYLLDGSYNKDKRAQLILMERWMLLFPSITKNTWPSNFVLNCEWKKSLYGHFEHKITSTLFMTALHCCLK